MAESIRNCSTLETAAALAGLTYRTFPNWMIGSEAGRRRYLHFFQAVMRAETEAGAVRIWYNAAETDSLPLSEARGNANLDDRCGVS